MAKGKGGRRPVVGLTAGQKRTLEVLTRIINKEVTPPTMAELGAILGITPASAHEQVNGLIEKGYLSRDHRKARSLKLVKSLPVELQRMVQIPVVGTVAAGPPLFADEDVIDHVSIDASLAARGRCFGLKVKGDSMIQANIKSGDIVVIRQQQMADNGDIIVALVDGEATCKKLFHHDGRIELRPENPKLKPIVIDVDQDFRIVGKVVGICTSVK